MPNADPLAQEVEEVLGLAKSRMHGETVYLFRQFLLNQFLAAHRAATLREVEAKLREEAKDQPYSERFAVLSAADFVRGLGGAQ